MEDGEYIDIYAYRQYYVCAYVCIHIYTCTHTHIHISPTLSPSFKFSWAYLLQDAFIFLSFNLESRIVPLSVLFWLKEIMSSLDNHKNQGRNVKCCIAGLSASRCLYPTKVLENTDRSGFPMSNHMKWILVRDHFPHSSRASLNSFDVRWV